MTEDNANIDIIRISEDEGLRYYDNLLENRNKMRKTQLKLNN